MRSAIDVVFAYLGSGVPSPLPYSDFCLKDGYHLLVTVKISLYEVLLEAFHSPFVINKKQLIY
jgi:hypothetical protein